MDMAEEEEEERIYTIPLRKTKNVSRPRRSPHAIKAIKQYVAKHMKSDLEDVWIDQEVNNQIWSKGIESPPSRIRVKAKRVDENLIEVTLPEE
jgi:large subunit ribosomal protein L31e